MASNSWSSYFSLLSARVTGMHQTQQCIYIHLYVCVHVYIQVCPTSKVLYGACIGNHWCTFLSLEFLYLVQL